MLTSVIRLFPLTMTIETKYSRMDQTRFFKGCLPQILLGPFLNTWTQLLIIYQSNIHNHYAKNEVLRYGFLQKMRPNPHFPAKLVTFTE